LAQRRWFSSRGYLIVALVFFIVAAILSILTGRYWFALSQAGFIGAVSLILAGVERKGGLIWPTLFWVSLAIGVLAVLAEGLI
jgi:hypothetical protein